MNERERGSHLVAIACCSVGWACLLVACSEASDPGAPTFDAAPAGGMASASDAGMPVDAASVDTGEIQCDLDRGTCRDPATGLVWQHQAAATAMPWSAASAHCAASKLDGGNWRLPRIQELRSLIRGCPNTAIGGACMASDPDCTRRACMAGCDQCPSTVINGERTCMWPAALAGSCESAYWTSTAYQDSIDPGAWYVDFGNGAFVHGWLASQPLLVRCVR